MPRFNLHKRTTSPFCSGRISEDANIWEVKRVLCRFEHSIFQSADGYCVFSYQTNDKAVPEEALNRTFYQSGRHITAVGYIINYGTNIERESNFRQLTINFQHLIIYKGKSYHVSSSSENAYSKPSLSIAIIFSLSFGDILSLALWKEIISSSPTSSDIEISISERPIR